MQGSTIAAIATPPGAGGIAVVRLSGAERYIVAARVFRPANPAKKVEQAKGYTALFGHFVDREEAFDEGVALFFRAPHSYTGEDVVELSCHGGSAVARRLVEACLAAGAQPAAPGEYTRRAVFPHLPKCLWKKRSKMAGSICEVTPSVCSLRSQPPSPRGRLSAVAERFPA